MNYLTYDKIYEDDKDQRLPEVREKRKTSRIQVIIFFIKAHTMHDTNSELYRRLWILVDRVVKV